MEASVISVPDYISMYIGQVLMSATLNVYTLSSSVYITGYTRYKMTYPVKKPYLCCQAFICGHTTNSLSLCSTITVSHKRYVWPSQWHTLPFAVTFVCLSCSEVMQYDRCTEGGFSCTHNNLYSYIACKTMRLIFFRANGFTNRFSQ